MIACHGLSASKESDKYLLLAAELPAAGLALARFDFRGCGESTGVEAETTIATRIEDVEAVMCALRPHPRLTGAFGLLGSSLGGFVALHVASREAAIHAVVTWNAPSDLHELANEDKRDQPGLGVPFFLELAEHRYDTCPTAVAHHLVVQGEADDVVPVDHAAVLHARAAEPCDLVIIPGGDHRLTDPEHRRQAVDVSREWFLRYLSRTEVPA